MTGFRRKWDLGRVGILIHNPHLLKRLCELVGGCLGSTQLKGPLQCL